jgi:hypothetical protein
MYKGGAWGVLVMFGEGRKLDYFYKDPMVGMENIIWCWASNQTLKWQKHNINTQGTKRDLLNVWVKE